MTVFANDEPIDAELWSHAEVAINSTQVLLEEHVAQGGWIPRHAMPSVGVFKGGWPSLTAGNSTDKANPPKFREMAAQEKGILKPFGYADLPDLADFLAYGLAQSRLTERLTIPKESLPQGPDAFNDWFVRYTLANLILQVIDRRVALGETSADSTRSIYCQLERGLLAPQLPIEVVVPILLSDLGLKKTLAISENLRIEVSDLAQQTAHASLVRHTGGVPQALVGAYSHSFVFSGLKYDNVEPWRRLWGEPPLTLPMHDIEDAFEVLRMATIHPTGFAQVLVRPLGWADRWIYDLPPLHLWRTVRRFPEAFDDFAWLGSRVEEDVDRVAKLPSLFARLTDSPPRVRIATRRHSISTLRSQPDDSTIDACIGIEALLGKDGEKEEIAHRLGLRAAVALANGEVGLDPHSVYRWMKSVYSLRSSLVHGLAKKAKEVSKIGEHEVEVNFLAQTLLLWLLEDYLSRDVGWTPESLDQAILAALSPSAPDDPDGTEFADGDNPED